MSLDTARIERAITTVALRESPEDERDYIFAPTIPVADLPDGRRLCMSSSFRDGGVRFKAIDLRTGRWELREVQGDLAAAERWFRAHKGKPYDWFGLLGWVFPWRVSNRRWWFCSEACAEAMGLPQSWRISPNDLYRLTAGPT